MLRKPFHAPCSRLERSCFRIRYGFQVYHALFKVLDLQAYWPGVLVSTMFELQFDVWLQHSGGQSDSGITASADLRQSNHHGWRTGFVQSSLFSIETHSAKAKEPVWVRWRTVPEPFWNLSRIVRLFGNHFWRVPERFRPLLDMPQTKTVSCLQIHRGVSNGMGSQISVVNLGPKSTFHLDVVSSFFISRGQEMILQ